MKPWLSACVLAWLAVPAAAQFDLFDWRNQPGGEQGWGEVDSATMKIGTGFNEPLGFQGFLTATPVDGTLSMTLTEYFTWDGDCTATVPVMSTNGVLTQIAFCATSNQQLRFSISAGDVFGFGMKVNSPNYPADVTFVDFEFTPSVPFAYWTDLGHALAGALGPPALAGQGLLYGGMPIKLKVTNAAPHNAATLVIGMSAFDAPFKGGVMVPTPDLLISGMFIGMGTLNLSASWPNGLPPGLQLWMQFWVVDPTAPLGLSATNGLLASTP